MPKRKPVELLTEEQREAIRKKFSVVESWKEEAAVSFGLWETLHSQPLPKGWHWQGSIKYNATYDVVEAWIGNDSNSRKGLREVEIVCTRAEAEDLEKLWPVIHTCIHGPAAYVWGRKRPLQVPQCPTRVKKSKLTGRQPLEDGRPAPRTVDEGSGEEPLAAVKAIAIGVTLSKGRFGWSFPSSHPTPAT